MPAGDRCCAARRTGGGLSGQINLYHPRFLKQRDLLALGNVAIAAAIVYVLLAAVGGWAWQYAAMRSDAAAAAEAQLKSAKERVEAETKAAASRKPDPQLAAELEAAESRLRRRVEIAGLLGVSKRTVDGDWALARLWITRALRS